MGKLSVKQEKFALAYLTGKSASDAYRQAYDAKGMSDKTINEAASRLLKNSKVAARVAQTVDRAAKKVELTVEDTLRMVARLGQFDIRKLYNEDGTLKKITEVDEDTAAAIGAIEIDEIKAGDVVIGNTSKIKMIDRTKGLDMAMKYLGLYDKDNRQKAPPQMNLTVVLVKAGAPGDKAKVINQ